MMTTQKTELVQLCDSSGRQTGTMEKLAAHREPHRHKAFSVVVFDPDSGDMLLQRRALTKYHTPGLWSNACCSHPRPDEATETAAHRRLVEELGFDVELKPAFDFTYKFHDDLSDLWEYEHDTVLIGYRTKSEPIEFNPIEVDAVRWVSTAQLDRWMDEQPDKFTFWFRLFLKKMRREGWLSSTTAI